MDSPFNAFTDKINVVIGAIIAVLSYIFGDKWFLFAAFLFMNFCDWITGWHKSYVNKKECSEKGWRGILKKIYYWTMIAVSFVMAEVFIRLGETVGVDLGVTRLLGWFVLASLFINEIRSIIENLVEAGIYVPESLKRGLKIANEMLKEAEQEDTDDKDKAS